MSVMSNNAVALRRALSGEDAQGLRDTLGQIPRRRISSIVKVLSASEKAMFLTLVGNNYLMFFSLREARLSSWLLRVLRSTPSALRCQETFVKNAGLLLKHIHRKQAHETQLLRLKGKVELLLYEHKEATEPEQIPANQAVLYIESGDESDIESGPSQMPVEKSSTALKELATLDKLVSGKQ